MEDMDLHIIHMQYHGWWPGDEHPPPKKNKTKKKQKNRESVAKMLT